MKATIYEKLGGFSNVRKMISDFYNRVLEVDDLSSVFAEVDMERIIDHQTKFFSMILGGPAYYSDKDLKSVHQPHKITSKQFDLTKECLEDTLYEFDLEDQDIDFILNFFESKREAILNEN